MTNSIFFLLVFVFLDLFLYLFFCGHLLGAFDITSQGSFRTPARQAGARHRHVGGSTMMAVKLPQVVEEFPRGSTKMIPFETHRGKHIISYHRADIVVQ